MQPLAQKYSSSTFPVLFALWLFATALNLNKAFHIDDTFHLEAAQWIEQNPLRPMSGVVNWDNDSASIFHFNQPALYFYLVALVGSLFGYSEIPLHLFQSLFTLLAIIVFFRIAQIVSPKHALVLTALFVLNPAFLVNQNLMVDVPLLSLHLLFIYILIKPDIKLAMVRYCLAATVLSIALLIKYTSFPLIMLLLIAPFLRREKKYALLAFIPLVVLGLWSLSNYLEYGSIHLFNRSANTLSVYVTGMQLLAFNLCIGAVAPFTVAFISGIDVKYRRSVVALTISSLLLLAGVCLLWYMGLITDRMTRHIFWGGFMINGLLALVLAFSRPLCLLWKHKASKETAPLAILVLWGLGMGSFIILLAPFMATRHVLLVIPPVLLLSSGLLDKVTFGMKASAVVVSLSLSLVLSLSDWIYADFYRKQAFLIKNDLPRNATVWSVGHWGWQWYSKAAGMLQYETSTSQVAVKDFIVVPQKIAKQVLSKNLVVKEVKNIVPPSSRFTYFSTSGTFASMYMSEYLVAPWVLIKAPVDTIKVLQVISVQPITSKR